MRKMLVSFGLLRCVVVLRRHAESLVLVVLIIKVDVLFLMIRNRCRELNGDAGFLGGFEMGDVGQVKRFHGRGWKF